MEVEKAGGPGSPSKDSGKKRSDSSSSPKGVGGESSSRAIQETRMEQIAPGSAGGLADEDRGLGGPGGGDGEEGPLLATGNRRDYEESAGLANNNNSAEPLFTRERCGNSRGCCQNKAHRLFNGVNNANFDGNANWGDDGKPKFSTILKLCWTWLLFCLGRRLCCCIRVKKLTADNAHLASRNNSKGGEKDHSSSSGPQKPLNGEDEDKDDDSRQRGGRCTQHGNRARMMAPDVSRTIVPLLIFLFNVVYWTVAFAHN